MKKLTTWMSILLLLSAFVALGCQKAEEPMAEEPMAEEGEKPMAEEGGEG